MNFSFDVVKLKMNDFEYILSNIVNQNVSIRYILFAVKEKQLLKHSWSSDEMKIDSKFGCKIDLRDG